MQSKSPEDINLITNQIIGCAFSVCNGLGNGFLEKVYENALAHELRKSGLRVEQQYPIQVIYDEVIVGDYVADLFVEDCVLVELKVVQALNSAHLSQCMNYLKATGITVCLLLNFYKPKLEIKRIVHRFIEPSAEKE